MCIIKKGVKHLAKTGYQRLTKNFKSVYVHFKTNDKLTILAQEENVSKHEMITRLVNSVFPDDQLAWDFKEKKWKRKES